MSTKRTAGARAAARRAQGTRRGERGDRVYRELRELIVRGRLAPGTRIIETEVASRLGVSRTPVRSAIQRLQQEGYIVGSDRRDGARPTVAPLTREDARELFGIVGAVEGFAAYRAALLPARTRAALARTLQRLNDAFRNAADRPRAPVDRIFELDHTFHRRYVEAGAGPRLLALHDAIKPQAERYARLYVSALLNEIRTSAAEHQEIIRAIEAGDPEAARRAVQTNWHNAAERLSRVVDALGERGSW